MFYPDILDYHKFRYRHRTCLTAEFIFTVLILLVQPIPFVHVKFSTPVVTSTQKNLKSVYTLNEMLYAFMIVRMAFVVKVILAYSRYTSLKAKRIARYYGVSANARFAFKAMISNRPGITVFLLIVLSVLILSFLLRIFER